MTEAYVISSLKDIFHNQKNIETTLKEINEKQLLIERYKEKIYRCRKTLNEQLGNRSKMNVKLESGLWKVYRKMDEGSSKISVDPKDICIESIDLDVIEKMK